VHALAQLVRHSRGLVTTVEKWVANTPPEALPGEVAEVLWVMRGALTDLTTTIGNAPASGRAGSGAFNNPR